LILLLAQLLQLSNLLFQPIVFRADFLSTSRNQIIKRIKINEAVPSYFLAAESLVEHLPQQRGGLRIWSLTTQLQAGWGCDQFAVIICFD